MSAVRVVFPLVFLLATAFAGEIKIKVVDPHAAAVSGAELILSRNGNLSPVSIQSTAADGTAVVVFAASGEYQLRVLAPGFAAEQISLTGSESPITVSLRLASST